MKIIASKSNAFGKSFKKFKSNGNSSALVVIRAIVGKGWGNGPQHSKSTHSWFANLPGIRVGLPTNAFDAKGMLLDSIFSDDPTILIEHRTFFGLKDYVPTSPYRIEFGKAKVVNKGNDITIVTIGYGILPTMKAVEILKKQKIFAEVIDIRSLYPLDIKTVLKSVKKTKRLMVVDPSWKSFGASSEIITSVIESFGDKLKTKPIRVSYPDSHTPMSENLEKKYYFDHKKLISKIKTSLK